MWTMCCQETLLKDLPCMVLDTPISGAMDDDSGPWNLPWVSDCSMQTTLSNTPGNTENLIASDPVSGIPSQEKVCRYLQRTLTAPKMLDL